MDNNRPSQRPTVRGKFIFEGETKLFVKGVTYGTFSPKEDSTQFPSPEVVAQDFAVMKENHVNCVRVYTVPPKWLLDCARDHGLWVMVGMPWEQHITFLDDPKRADDIVARLRRYVRNLGRHPAILVYAVGNEIPPAIVRWYGRQKIEAFIRRLYLAVKEEDPEGLVTYVNFPTTEYLQLSFLDIISFNVYLEDQDVLQKYLARLHNLTDDKPLLMAEIGLDSRRNGQDKQAQVLDWQVKSVFAMGCAGILIFSWTDEWYRGGMEIHDWDFGLTTRQRLPKAALSVIKDHFAGLPFPGQTGWPRVSVFVCSYNGSRTIRKTLEELSRLNYPYYEVVVVNDGSKDTTPQIAQEFNVRLISTPNRGLSAARNEALKDEAAGIVAYIDDDAYPDPDWLKYLVHTLMTSDVMAVGGPNLLPLESGIMANCVGNAPGGATHVLIDDRTAEHIPGCNMAFRKEALVAVGGFDPQFRSAGDDVDLCWRIQRMGWRIGYHPSAFVWHGRRNTLKTYWKQQVGYGKAEALLEDKWPDKYNAVGHIPWSGRLYGKGKTLPLLTRSSRVYQGVWGTALFQSIYEPAPGILFSLPLMPEWYLLVLFLGFMTWLGFFWQPLIWTLPLFVFSVLAPVVQAMISAGKAEFTIKNPAPVQNLILYTVTAYLHILQPLARLRGRFLEGLTPFKGDMPQQVLVPKTRVISIWQEEWQSVEDTLNCVLAGLRKQNVPIHFGGAFDNWDLEVRGGLLGSARVLLTVEEHGQGKQMLRFRITPHVKIRRTFFIGLFALGSFMAACDHAWTAAGMLMCIWLWLLARMRMNCSFAKEALLVAIDEVKGHRVADQRKILKESLR